MLKFILRTEYLQDVLFNYSILMKSAVRTHHLFIDIYREHAPSNTTFKELFWRFTNGYFDVNGKPRKCAPHCPSQSLELLSEE